MSEGSWVRRNVPILSWLPAYDRSWITTDAIAGLTVWGLVVPESMAYAGVAGLPPEFGLYTLVCSLLLYAVLGSSRHVFVQPTSASAALIASSVTAVMVAAGVASDAANIDPALYQEYVAAFVIVVGLVFLLARLARLGFVTQFLSKPVLDGFITGLAVYVLVGQLYKFFGVEKTSGNTVQKFVGVVQRAAGGQPGDRRRRHGRTHPPDPAATLEPADPGGPDRPVRLDRPQLGARAPAPSTGSTSSATCPRACRRRACRTCRCPTGC